MEIQPATPEDREIIVRFNADMAQETEDRALDLEVLGAGVDTLLRQPALGRYWIARNEGNAIGQIMVTYEWSDWRNGLFWWIQSVYVAPAWRRRGVFSALYKTVELAARQSDTACGLRLYVERENFGAIETYHALAMRDTPYRMLETVFAEPASC